MENTTGIFCCHATCTCIVSGVELTNDSKTGNHNSYKHQHFRPLVNLFFFILHYYTTSRYSLVYESWMGRLKNALCFGQREGGKHTIKRCRFNGFHSEVYPYKKHRYTCVVEAFGYLSGRAVWVPSFRQPEDVFRQKMQFFDVMGFQANEMFFL